MKIAEIFYSIQGEGSWLGLPNIFIRTSGCNLRCSFCDTQYAYDEGKEMNIEEIFDAVLAYPCRYICLTGGEPLFQHETENLINVLLKKKYILCVETNGSLPIDALLKKKSLIISLDIKSPSSRMHKKMLFENISKLSEKDQLKFVMQNRIDYEYAKTVLQEYSPRCQIFFQPVWGIDAGKIAHWILNDGLSVKLGFQLHKFIFGDKRGV